MGQFGGAGFEEHSIRKIEGNFLAFMTGEFNFLMDIN